MKENIFNMKEELKKLVKEAGITEVKKILTEIERECASASKEKEMEDFFVEILNGLELEIHDEYNLYKKNDYIYIYQDKKSDVFHLGYGKIWSIFEKKFKLNYYEIQEFTKKMLLKHTKMNVSTTSELSRR